MRIVMRKHGMEDKHDFTIVEVGLPNMKAVLGDRKVDLVPGMIPFSLDPDKIKITRTLFVQRDTVGVTQVIPWAIPNLDAMEKNVHMAHELGFIKADLDVKRYADLSIVEEAGKRLK